MKTKINYTWLLAMIACSGILFSSCRNTDEDGAVPPGFQDASIYLTDDAGLFDKVLIDVQSVQVLVDTSNGAHSTDSCKTWEPLDVVPGIYDLLQFRNGNDTLLAAAEIKAGDISFIKIKLGPSNTVVKNNVTYPLNIPDSSFILVNVQGVQWDQEEFHCFKLWLDFDVSKSIVLGHNNQYYLYPAIKVFDINTTGTIMGSVFPQAADPVITVYNGTDTINALPESTGDFQVCGLNPGTYQLKVNASNGYVDTTINNITVTASDYSDEGYIYLHQ
jgi:uncharacterized protein DUF4382